MYKEIKDRRKQKIIVNGRTRNRWDAFKEIYSFFILT